MNLWWSAAFEPCPGRECKWLSGVPLTTEEIADFLASRRKRLPTAPTWRPHKSRDGEVRARLPVDVDGVLVGPEIEVTLRTTDPSYIVIVLLTPECVSRLCIGAGHHNRITGARTEDPHFHKWDDNAHLAARVRANLPFTVSVPTEARTRDAAFAWFLEEVGIESPGWLPVNWPGQGVLF